MSELPHIYTIYRSARALSGCGVTASQFIILTACAEQPCSMTFLAKLLHCSTASVTGMMDRMIRLELVSRDYHPEDRRSVMARTTTTGLEILARVNEAFQRIV